MSVAIVLIIIIDIQSSLFNVQNMIFFLNPFSSPSYRDKLTDMVNVTCSFILQLLLQDADQVAQSV